MRLLGFSRQRVAPLDNPLSIGEALSGAKLNNCWQYRVGDRRIVCDIDDQRIVVHVLRSGNGREVIAELAMSANGDP